MSFNLKIKSNLTRFSWYYAFYNFRLHSVLAIIYFAQITHSYALAISIYSIAQLSQALLELPSGIYSDKLGRSNCLKLGALASLISIIFYAFGSSYFYLAIGAIFDGLNRAFFSGNNDALLYETLVKIKKKETYQHELGKLNSNLELSGFFGIILGSLVATKSLQLLFILSIIPQFLGLIVSLGFVEPQKIRINVESIFLHLKEALAYYQKNSKLRNISLASILGYGVGESSWALQGVFYNTLLPPWAVSLMLSLNFLTSSISFRLSGKILTKIKALNLLIYQEITNRILYFLALIHPTFISPIIMAVASFSYGPSTVAKNSLLQLEFSNKQRATMASINSLVGNCFFAIFAILLGSLTDKFGPTKSLLLAQVCLVPIIFLYLQVKKSSKL